jgi:Flp pilus assembly protein TadG
MIVFTRAPRADRRHADSSRRRTAAGDDGGYVLPLLALMLVPLLVATAFAVDLGAWYAQGNRIQRAADAAALAGVVWAADEANPTKWDTVARETATKNGFTNGVNGVTVTTQKLSQSQIRVTIGGPANQYFSSLVYKGQRLNRAATAEYVLPVPLGSPRNAIGTGGLGTGASGTAYEPERLWMAISGYCTDRVQGDLIASRYFNGTDNNNCTGSLNPLYSDTNYQYYIELPSSRSYNTDVILYHGNFVDNTDNCGSGGYLSSPQPNEFCPGGLDGQSAQPTTFTLYQPDGTPLDDNDNPLMSTVSSSSPAQGCGSTSAGVNGTKTFNALDNSPTDSNYDFNPSSSNFTDTGSTSNSGWWRICQIPSSAPGGRYILKVRNATTTSGAATAANGSNAFSIVATPSGTQKLCDARSDTTCPKVFAKDHMSVYARQGGAANFFLAEIGPEHAGKKVTVSLWDSAEGASELRIKRPTGTNTWTDQTFSYTSSCGTSGTAGPSGDNVTSISSPSFNGCSLNITFSLTSYNPPTDNRWWRVYYVYGSDATDRTTWSVTISGDPVHLVQ